MFVFNQIKFLRIITLIHLYIVVLLPNVTCLAEKSQIPI